MPVVKSVLIEVIERVKRGFPDHCLGHFRSLYGITMEGSSSWKMLEKITDPRIRADEPIDPSSVCVATTDTSWRSTAGKQIRDLLARLALGIALGLEPEAV